MTKKTLFLIPDGVGIRNYLYSDVLKNLKKESKVAFWSPLLENAFTEVKQLHSIEVEYKKLQLNAESPLTRLYREAGTFGRLIHNAKLTNNQTILTNWNYSPKTLKLKILNKLSESLGTWASKKYSRILVLEQKSLLCWKRSIIDEYKEELLKLNPSSIFITHQRKPTLTPIIIAAKEIGIPIVTAIYSWDNLPKGRLAVQADQYIVWSDYMKEEVALYYPEINPKNVVVTGSPQFEFYSKVDLIFTREQFALKYGLDINKKWICFSGDDKITSPNDPLYLKDIMKGLSNDKKINDIQVIFRRCPGDFSNRYDTVLKEYDNIVSIDPEWHTTESGWIFFFPKYSDIGLLVNLAYHCELVINIGSTMAHDFAILNKPCLYINYNQNNSVKWDAEIIYKFQHFKSMEGFDAVGWLNSSEEISTKILDALSKPNTVGKDRTKWLEKIIQHPLNESSKKIADALLKFN